MQPFYPGKSKKSFLTFKATAYLMPFRRYNVTSKGVDFVNKKLVAMTTYLRDRKIYLRSFICGQSYTILANFVKIGPVDVEIIGLTEITKKYFKRPAKYLTHLRLLSISCIL